MTPRAGAGGAARIWGRDDVIVGCADRECPVYSAGEKMTFTFALRGFDGLDASSCRFAWTRTGDDGRREAGSATADRPLMLATSLDRPGFVRYYVELVDADGRPVMRGEMDDEDNRRVRFDGGAGADILDIRPAVPPPADFHDFWKRAKDELAAAAPHWRMDAAAQRIDSGRGDVDLFAVSVPCAGGRPATGFLSVPAGARDGRRYPADVSFYGYNGSWSPHATQKPAANRLRTDVVQLFSSAHGFELMRERAYYRELRAGLAVGGYDYAFDPVSNADPRRAYFRGMAFRVMRGLEYLKSRPEWDGRGLTVHGGSMGGLQTIFAAALDRDVKAAKAECPWCCDMGGVKIGRNRGTWHVKWTPALGYYDPVNLARLISPECDFEVPRMGLGDYVCPPSGVMAFYNTLKCRKRLCAFQNSRHGYIAPEPFQRFRLDGDAVV